MSSKKSQLIRWGIGLGLTAYVLTLIDFHELREVFSRGHWGYLMLATVIVILDRIWMGAKWNILLRAQGVFISYFQCIRAYFIASFVGLALPTSVGSDLVRLMSIPVSKGEREKVAASIVVEKALAMFALFLLAIFCVFLMVWTAALPHWKYFYWAIAFFSVITLVFLGSLYYLPHQKLLNRFSGKIPHVLGKIVSAYQQFRNYPRAMAVFFICSFAEQLVPFLFNCVIARAFELPGSLLGYFMVVPLIYIVARIPISVDAIGVLEFLFVILFPLVGLDRTNALLLALAGRVATTLGHLTGGVFYFWRKKDEIICTDAGI
jgi:uncharacterized protein (TIRG00374 family)